MRKRLIEKYLPMWAKETVLAENRALQEKLRQAQAENARLHAFIEGMTHALRTGRRREEK